MAQPFDRKDCHFCADPAKDPYCIGVYYNCRICIKPVVYDYLEPIIIVSPLYEHYPFWWLPEHVSRDLHKAIQLVSNVMETNLKKFPNFFIGGNVDHAKYGVDGVHVHVHIEPRVKEDPNFATFPAHSGKRELTPEEIEKYKTEWKKLLKFASHLMQIIDD